MARRSEVRGGRETAAVLRGMARAITPAQVDRAHRAALAPMQAAARAEFMANGSYKTGVLPREFVIVKTASLEHRLGCVGMAAKLMHLIEFGTAPHFQPGRGRMHPGAAPKPAFRPAFEQTRDDALRAAGRVYGDELSRIAAALRRIP